MSYLDLLNSLCPTPASRMKLITIRNQWTDSYKRKAVSMLHPEGGRVVDQAALEVSLKETHGAYLVTFMHSLIAAGVHLDALLMVPLSVPLNRQPIAYSRVLDLSPESAHIA
ncbi:hypothetical protein [Pseudomonas mucoides]|uniref:hypothetical protein n=1 Tax=Pseudomonas mucoides TaxID=2730424 RepID=UPI0018921B75|nr:hypothetical protein [Pseudomonas mucoides]